MKDYITKQGDMWDSIAYSQLGNVSFADKLMSFNPAYIDYYIFPAGVTLVIPDISANTPNSLPPWKQVSG